MKRAFIVTQMEHWNDIFRLNQRFMSNFVFRGQGNTEWPLSTSLARMVSNHHPNYADSIIPASYEEQMMNEFKWKYPSYEKIRIPGADEAIEWLSLMQHYGSPTRMLDFSQSMYVALFMAIDGSFFPSSAIWAINRHVLNERIIQKYNNLNNCKTAGYDAIDDFIYQEATLAINSRYRQQDLCLYMARPHLANERINRQQGLFIIPSSIEVGFAEILNDYFDNKSSYRMKFGDLARLTTQNSYGQQTVSVLKIEIPKVLKFEISNLLRQMNITSETMYPGLDGLARSMSCLRDSSLDYKTD